MRLYCVPHLLSNTRQNNLEFNWLARMTTSPDFSFYINDRHLGFNIGAVVYALVGYGLGIYGTLQPALWLNLLGTVLITHSLVWSAYLIHDLIHGNLFQTRWNGAIAQVLLFLTGSCYSRYRSLASHHLAHHKNRSDIVSFSIIDFLKQLPKPILRLVIVLEWLYFPIVELGLRWMSALSPFLGENRRGERRKNALLLLLRGGLYSTLVYVSPKAAILYFIAYISFLNVLRFVDCFQHTYEVFRLDQTPPSFDLAYEESNTFSNLVSVRFPWLNLLLFNFGYHNAHHRVMRCPWYLLPRLDSELYPRRYSQYVTLPQLVKNFHQFRVVRLFQGQGAVVATDSGLDLTQFVGAVGASFLVSRESMDWLKLPDSEQSDFNPETA
jgi:fatty acid desaturase